MVERIATDAELLPEPRPTINYILGFPTDDQYQSKGKKKSILPTATVRARINTIPAPVSNRIDQPIDDPISFPPINPSKVIVPHHDALILTLCINDFDVHRVLVDPSSTVDLLQLLTFRQMNIFLDKLSSAGIILSGFHGATIVIMGDITLLVRAGPVAQQVLFLAVEDVGPYNAIVGQAWLHAMKAGMSIYHQMISYFTRTRQADLLSSQLAVRQCKTRENFNLWKKGKIVILVKARNFSRSRMTKRISPLESSHEI